MQGQAGSCFHPFQPFSRAHLSSLPALDDTKLGSFQHSCWFQALEYTGISPGFGRSCGPTLPALGPSLSALRPLCTGRFSFSISPQSQVPCPFHAAHPHQQHLLPVSSCPGCPTTDVSPGGTPFALPCGFPFSPFPPCCSVSLFFTLFISLLFSVPVARPDRPLHPA